MPKIGDSVWVFNQNRRVYAKAPRGQYVGAPIWREHWEEREIIDETRVSWVLRGGGKIKKSANPRAVAFSEEEIDRRAFVKEKQVVFAGHIRECASYEAMKEIEAALIKHGIGISSPNPRSAP